MEKSRGALAAGFRVTWLEILKVLKTKSLSELHKSLFKMVNGPMGAASRHAFRSDFRRLFHSFCGEVHAMLANPMGGARILIVEDEPDLAEALVYNLRKEGFEVQVRDRGDTALEAIRRDPPDLVLLDLMLPGLDGLELTRILKRDAT